MGYWEMNNQNFQGILDNTPEMTPCSLGFPKKQSLSQRIDSLFGEEIPKNWSRGSENNEEEKEGKPIQCCIIKEVRSAGNCGLNLLGTL